MGSTLHPVSGTVSGMGTFLQIVHALATIGRNVTDKQRSYLEWRMSDAGQAYFTRKENNRFYEALDRGDTDVLDAVRRSDQNDLDAEWRSLYGDADIAQGNHD